MQFSRIRWAIASFAVDFLRCHLDVGRGLARLAAEPPDSALKRLEELAASTPLHDLERALRETVEGMVREEFEQLRRAEAARAEEAWRTAAAHFRARTQERVDAIRRTAEGIFELRLGELRVPEVAEERERFFYLFLHLESVNEAIARGLRRLLPGRVLRRRLTETARRQLVSELDKHAGRARWDISQRLDGVRRRFEAAMRDQLAQVTEGVVQATERAKKRQSAVAAELAGDVEQAAVVRDVMARARAAASERP